MLRGLPRGERRGGRMQAALASWLGVPITAKDGAFWTEFFGSSSFLGKSVSVDQALQLSTVWACVRLIAETIATLPLALHKRKADGSRVVAYTHPLYVLLHEQPNADMTAVVFWEVVVASMLLWGNAYVELIRVGSRLVALDFLLPARMTVRRNTDGSVTYEYRDLRGKTRTIAETDMMHIPAFSTDGILGLSPVVYGANVFGTSIETDRASAETFRDTLRSPGLVTMDMVLQKEQRDQVRKHVKQVSDEGGVFVLEKGAKFEKIGFDPVTAELLASRRWNVEEMCRWYRVDPAMVGYGGKDSNWGTGLEQKNLWFITFTLRHWCVRIEQSIKRRLLTPVERITYFPEFNMEGLLRGDSAARSTFYSSMTQNGLMTRDECRVKENLPPKGGNADVLTVQVNLVPIDKLGEKQTPPPAPLAPPPPDGTPTEEDGTDTPPGDTAKAWERLGEQLEKILKRKE